MPWPAAIAVALIVAALAVLATVVWMRRRGERELAHARRQALAWQQLVVACRWHSDAAHVVRAVVGSGACPPRAAQAVGSPVWQWLAAAEDDDLRRRFEAQGPIADLPVRAAADDTALWTLHAVPLADADGRFAGHAGTLAPRLDPRAAQRERAVVEALWPRLPGPAWLALRDGGQWRIERASPAAAALTESAPATWTELLAALGADLRRAVEGLEAGGGTAQQGRWQLQLATFDAGGREARLLALWPVAASDDGAAAEQQSVSFAVSHDLRAPLRVVEGFTRILKEDYGRQLDRIGNDHLDRVLGACARMGQMIDALLALARLSNQPLARQPVNLSQLAGFVVDDLRRQYPAPPADVTIEPGLVVQGDPTLLRVVLENLLGNAWKYSARTERRRIVLQRTRHDGRDAFVVSDNGAGFDMRFADRLFGIFQRLHGASEFPGTGVGLASVRRIVARHGGQIWAEGEVGRGARFYFTLGG